MERILIFGVAHGFSRGSNVSNTVFVETVSTVSRFETDKSVSGKGMVFVVPPTTEVVGYLGPGYNRNRENVSISLPHG